MDDAGKDVKALKETAGGKHAPRSAFSRVAPRSAQLMQDHSLLVTSVWCGMVFSLALVLTAINLLPPVPVGYRVSTQVIASPQRLDLLKRQLLADTVADFGSVSGEPSLIGITVLDDQSPAVPAQTSTSDEHLTLVEVRSLWPTRTSSDRVHQWLSTLSEPDQRTLSQVDSASAKRLARWEVQVAEHYLKHFRHTGRKQINEESGDEATLVNTADGPPTRFASLTTGPASETEPQTGAAADDVEARLIQEFQRATASEQSAAQAVQEQALKLSGSLTLSGLPRVRAQPGRVPSAMVLSILVLAIAGGAIGGWAHHRAQSGGIFYAAEVARNMDVLGLPTLGVIRIAGLQAATGKVYSRVTSFRRWATKQALAVTELVVMFWCMAIAIRLVLDPLWRAMLWDNPLAALGRLFVGLP